MNYKGRGDQKFSRLLSKEILSEDMDIKTVAVRTVLSPDTAAQLYTDFYSNDVFGNRVVACELQAVTANEHYIVTTDKQRFVLCIHNHSKPWLENAAQSASPITPQFEFQLLAHLQTAGMPVVRSLPTRDQASFAQVNAAEGVRYVSLYEYAEGGNVYPPNVAQAERMGEDLAAMHDCLDQGFDYGESQPVIFDADRLLYQSVLRICQFLGDRRPDVQRYLQDESEVLMADLASLPSDAKAFGPIYGGMTGLNHHVNPDGEIHYFGFGQAGLGWRVYDMAVFLWHAKLYQIPTEIPEAFQSAYLSRRSMDAEILSLVPQLIKTKMIYTMGYHAAYAQWIGRSFMDDAYWGRHITPMQQW